MASRRGAVTRAVENDLARIAARSPELAESGLAAAALALARRIDSASTSPTAASMCSRELREHMDRLGELTPAEASHDRLDDLAGRRDARRAAP